MTVSPAAANRMSTISYVRPAEELTQVGPQMLKQMNQWCVRCTAQPTRTILQRNGPDHLGLWLNRLSSK